MTDFSILAEFKDHPGMFTVLCVVIVVCVFMTITLPKILKFLGSRQTSINVIDQKLNHMLTRIEYVEKHTTANTSNGNDMKTELGILIHESRERDMRIAVLTLYNERLPLWDRMDAALTYFALGGNHNAEMYVAEMIMKEPDPKRSVQLWFDTVAKFTRKVPDQPMEYIQSCLNNIQRKVT